MTSTATCTVPFLFRAVSDIFTAGQLTRAAVELAKLWRTDKYLRRLDVSVALSHSFSFQGQHLQACPGRRSPGIEHLLQAVMVVADKKQSLTITGNGDVLEPNDGIIGEQPSRYAVYLATSTSMEAISTSFERWMLQPLVREARMPWRLPEPSLTCLAGKRKLSVSRVLYNFDSWTPGLQGVTVHTSNLKAPDKVICLQLKRQ